MRLALNMVDESGTIFWDQHSGDGADYNFGYCATGLGNVPWQVCRLGRSITWQVREARRP